MKQLADDVRRAACAWVDPTGHKLAVPRRASAEIDEVRPSARTNGSNDAAGFVVSRARAEKRGDGRHDRDPEYADENHQPIGVERRAEVRGGARLRSRRSRS